MVNRGITAEETILLSTWEVFLVHLLHTHTFGTGRSSVWDTENLRYGGEERSWNKQNLGFKPDSKMCHSVTLGKQLSLSALWCPH